MPRGQNTLLIEPDAAPRTRQTRKPGAANASRCSSAAPAPTNWPATSRYCRRSTWNRRVRAPGRSRRLSRNKPHRVFSPPKAQRPIRKLTSRLVLTGMPDTMNPGSGSKRVQSSERLGFQLPITNFRSWREFRPSCPPPQSALPAAFWPVVDKQWPNGDWLGGFNDQVQKVKRDDA